MGKGRDKRRKSKEKKQKRQPPPTLPQEPAHAQPDRTNSMSVGFRLNYGAEASSS